MWSLPVSKIHFFSICYSALICTVMLARFLLDGLTEDGKWKVILSDGLLGGGWSLASPSVDPMETPSPHSHDFSAG